MKNGRKRRFLAGLKLACLLAGCLFLLVRSAAAETLAGPSMYSSARQYQPGDVVTVVVSESAEAQQSASTSLNKEAKMGYTTGGLLGTLAPSGNVGVTAGQEGGGNLSRQGEMRAMVAATVREVMPNGNLRLSGSQQIEFDSGTQIIRVEGVARPRDVNSQNEVYSYRLADARITYSGEGALHEKARTGFLTRLLDILWIF
ncbi:MAG: flagellar basal body L-ring protein FlgH [candidate division FCPU426 bacterium]